MSTLKRRAFLQAGAAAGVWLASAGRAAEPGRSGEDAIHVALLGAGAQGRTLASAAVLLPGLRLRAVCDIWRYSRRALQTYLAAYQQEANDYADYQEMLAKEKGLHAVIVATPDSFHAEHANACLRAGLHVYCEKCMSNSIELARSMVRTARETGKLLQIGYQRRSNPRYRHVAEKLLGEARLAGRLTHVAGQWNHPVRDDVGWPVKFAMRDEELRRYGYASMHELRNWRALKKYGGGPFADFGAHQVDVVHWFLGALPKSVLAVGGRDYYQQHEWHDNAMAALEYDTPQGTVRALCQVQTTTSGGGLSAFEHFMGTEGSIRIAEHARWTGIFREAHTKEWDEWVRGGLLVRKEEPAAAKPLTSEEAHARETGVVVPYELPVVLDKPIHQPHLENFFEAVRGKARLACPAETAFAAEVVVHKVNEAIEAKKLLAFAPEEFRV